MHLLDRSTLMYLINSFVFCKLFYCSTVWSNTSNENIRKLQLVQTNACRIVTGLKKYNRISEALKFLKWLNVKKNYSLMTSLWFTNAWTTWLLTIFVNDLNNAQKFTKEIPGKSSSLRCPSAGSRQGKGPSPSVVPNFLILYLSILETRKA